MTITNPDRTVTATGNGATTAWPYTFQIPDAASANVITTVVATGVQTVIAAADYTITGLGDSNGGEVTYPTAASGDPALTSATEITVYRAVPQTQEVSVTNQTRYDAGVVETVWDRLTMMIQDLTGDALLFLGYPKGDTENNVLPTAALRANKVVAFDVNGGATVSTATISELESGATDAAASAAAALVSENSAAASETNAAASETNAATSETNAATSETNAATSETNAGTSETNAAASAAAADVSKIEWQGAYNAGTAYALNDAVADSGSSFICIQAGTGNAPAVGGTAFWDDLANKGADGVGDLLAANNLSDVASAVTSLSNIGGIGAATTDTFTNKTFDADGTGNALSNVDIGNAIAASQAEAEAGTDNTKLVTPLRVAQAVSALGGGGKIAQIQTVQTSTVITSTAQIPADNTIPQNTEGTELFTLAITPSNASNILHFFVNIPVLAQGAYVWKTCALFQDSTANALATFTAVATSSLDSQNVVLQFSMVAGTTSATTFKVRMGPNFGATLYTNSNTGGARYGGTWKYGMTIMEEEV